LVLEPIRAETVLGAPVPRCGLIWRRVCGLRGLLSLFVASVKMLVAGRFAAWCWQGISTLLCVGLLLMYARSQQGGWLLALALVLKRGGVADS
jgi:hypothetical protein